MLPSLLTPLDFQGLRLTVSISPTISSNEEETTAWVFFDMEDGSLMRCYEGESSSLIFAPTWVNPSSF